MPASDRRKDTAAGTEDGRLLIKLSSMPQIPEHSPFPISFPPSLVAELLLDNNSYQIMMMTMKLVPVFLANVSTSNT